MKRLSFLLAIFVVLVLTASTTPRAYCGWAGDVRSFARVGDSISESHAYMHPLANADKVQIEPALNHLWASIGYFRQASFERSSVAAVPGIHSQGLLDPARCNGVSLIQCEYDQINPRTALIMVGTNDPAEWATSGFSQHNIETIVKYTLDRGIVPVLFTIPKNINKDISPLNLFITQLAYKYGLYLIDSSSVAISADGVHPSVAPVGLEAVLQPELYGYGQTMRNRDSLIALDYLRKSCKWY